MNHNQVPCSVCKNLFNKKSLIPSEFLRPEILDLIRSKEVAWTPAPICRNCLDIFRNQWIDQLMQREKGELTAIEEAVVKSFKDQLSISENINSVFLFPVSCSVIKSSSLCIHCRKAIFNISFSPIRLSIIMSSVTSC